MLEFNRTYWEEMYHMPLEELPWEIKEAPAEIKKYVEQNKIAGGCALDAGCGTGNFSEYLARNGFIVTGVDYSEKALEIARKNNEQNKLPITYVRSDLTRLAQAVGETKFDLILDYKVSHHISSPRIEDYIDQCVQIL